MRGASRTEHAAAVLATLPSEELAITLESAMSERLGVQKAAVLRVYIAALLDEDEQVGRIAGPARNVIAHMDAQARRQLLIRSAAHHMVLQEPMLESSAVAEALGRTGTNGREAASKLRLASRLVGIRQQNKYLYPAFQFDFVDQRVNDNVQIVNRLLDAVDDPWGVSSWWVASNPRLEGKAPKDLLGTDREDDLPALARSESSE